MTQMINDRNAWIGFAVLLLLVALLGVKSRKTAQNVLNVDVQSGVSTVHTIVDPHGIAVIARRDSILASAETLPRNPFRRNRVVAAAAQRTQPESTFVPEEPAGPRLLTLLYDDVGPCVQITIGSERSGWLHVGEIFKGWKVDEIANSTVNISSRNRQLVLK